MVVNLDLYVIIPALIGAIPFLVQKWDIGRALDEALEEAHVPKKVAADAMGITKAQLSRALSGCGPEHLSAQRLTRLPDRVWWRLIPKLAEQCAVALPAADERAEHLARVVTRAVRATVRRETKETVHELA